MKSILICTVGGSAEPILNELNHLRHELEFVYFICSGTGQLGNGISSVSMITEGYQEFDKEPCQEKNCVKQIVRKMPAIPKQAQLSEDQYKVIVAKDPDWLRYMFQACEEILEDMQVRFGESLPRFRIRANYTGGTKTMGCGLVLFSEMLEQDWDLRYNGGARRDLSRISEGDIPQTQSLLEFKYHFALSRAKEFEQRYDFDAAYTIMYEFFNLYGSHLHHREELNAEVVQQLNKFKFKAHLDRFEYRKALELAPRIGEESKNEIQKLKRIERALILFEQEDKWSEKDSANGRELLEDILNNASRCAQRQRFDDAVGRLYRVTELLAQIHLKRWYEINTSAVPVDHKALTSEWKNEQKNSIREDHFVVGLTAAWKLLCLFEDDPLGKFYLAHGVELKKYLNARNQSFFAHGLKSINETDWRIQGKPWQTWLEAAIQAAYT